MADILSPADRSRLMARVRQASTAPELALRSALHALGLRFRINARELPGRPDIVLPRHRVALFVHGCFWHGHSCRAGRTPTSNTAYWGPKLAANKQRDRIKARLLRALGWHVWTVWECQLKRPERAAATAARLAVRIRGTVRPEAPARGGGSETDLDTDIDTTPRATVAATRR